MTVRRAALLMLSMWVLVVVAAVVIVALAGCDPDDIGPAQKPVLPSASTR